MTSTVAARPTNQMRVHLPIRFAAAASLAFAALLPAQATQVSRTKPAKAAPAAASLPATPPTTTPELPPTPEQLPPHPASVTYARGLLTVSAGNSSLNQILRDISRETGMKITGGVVDERVFGNYGPASADKVLATLLDGTASNMLLVHGNGPAPEELVLTPQNGGPTPPNPNAAAIEERELIQDQHARELLRARQEQAAHQNQNHPANPPAHGTSPNAVKTPQEIYDQLMKMRQQQQKPNSQ